MTKLKFVNYLYTSLVLDEIAHVVVTEPRHCPQTRQKRGIARTHGTGTFCSRSVMQQNRKTHPIFKHTFDNISTTRKQVKYQILYGFDDIKLPG